MKKPKLDPAPIVFRRADPEALAKFDPTTKECTMNCGPHGLDPRSKIERLFMCGDCVLVSGNEENMNYPEQLST